MILIFVGDDVCVIAVRLWQGEPSLQPTFSFASQSVFRSFQANGTAIPSFKYIFL